MDDSNFLSNFTEWFLNFGTWILEGFFRQLVRFLNWSIEVFCNGTIQVVNMFPANPCQSLIASCADVSVNLPEPDYALLQKCISFMNWILPMEYLVNLVGCTLITVMAYFLIAPIARWFKLLT